MCDRITDKHLQALADRINEVTGSPMVPWSREAGADRMTANVGNFHLSHAYGGVCLHRMHNTGGGVSTPLCYGHVTRRELYDAMHAFLSGLTFTAE